MWGWKVSASGSRRRRSFSLAAVAVAAAAGLGGQAPALAADIFEIGLPQPVTALRMDGDNGVVTLGEETFLLLACDRPEGVCLQTAAADAISKRVPSGDLPDGFVAIAETGDIRNAWYGEPTERYGHGVLGDAIEGGSLIVLAEDGKKTELVLPETHVFEDITPRIHDLDGDGRNEVIAIRSSLTAGAGVAVYGLRDGELAELAASEEIGRPNRWLNIAGIIDAADGSATIYAVRTPHIGGELYSLSFSGDAIEQSEVIAADVSNHVIGSRELGLSATGDLGDGTELVLLSQDRLRLRFPLSDKPNIALPEAIDKALIVLGGRIVTATETGRLLAVAP